MTFIEIDSKLIGIQKAFKEFMSGSDAELFCDRATQADWSGDRYYVELFPDGHYRGLWGNQVGNLYESSGLLLRVPYLDDSEWDEDPSLRFYDGCYSVLQDWFDEAISEL